MTKNATALDRRLASVDAVAADIVARVEAIEAALQDPTDGKAV